MSAASPSSPSSTSPTTNESFASAGRQTSTSSSYAGGLWNMYFNGKSALSEVFRRDLKLKGDTPAYILGRMHEDSAPEHMTQWVNMNVKHIHYFSYRNKIPVPLSNGMDHDAGWGCMIRTGQMMLCEALRRCLPENDARNCQSLFCDTPSAPFGLHAMTQMGVRSHIPVGQWFSPTGLAHTLKRIVAECPLTAPVLGVVIAQDGAIRREEISNEFIEGKFCLVLVPVMAGRDKVPPDMQQALLETFTLERTLGIVGGRPKQSFYFVGCQADLVFYLDPHTVQSAFVSPETVGNASGVRGTMPISDIDPSMLLCFLLTRNRDLEEWENSFEGPGRINSKTEYPMFTILRRKPSTRRASQGQGAAATASPPAATRIDSADALPSAGASPASNMAAPLKPIGISNGSGGAGGVVAPLEPDDDVDDCTFDSEVEKEVEREHSPKVPPSAQAAAFPAASRR